jgi:tumor protein p53-inducible protein 3
MKAVLQQQPGGRETLFIGELEAPQIKPTEVLVRVHATALNRADILQREGKYPPPPGASELMGLEAAGEIYDTGDEVPGEWQAGDLVMCLLAGGGHAEQVAVDYRLLMRVPNRLTLEQAAALPEVFLTAYQTLFWEADAKKGETVLIHAGASGVGTAAIQLAKAKGLSVIVTASKGKHQICLDLGADLAIDYKEEDFVEKVKGFTAGIGAHIVLDFIGGPYLQKNLEVLAVEGRLIQIAMMGGAKSEINLMPVLTKRLQIKGTTLRARSLTYKHELIRAFEGDFMEAVDAGDIRPYIDTVYALEDIREAHAHMEANRNVGKIVLEVQ